MSKAFKIISAIFIFYIICSSVLIFWVVKSYEKKYSLLYTDKYNGLSDEEITNFTSNCQGLDLQDTTKCLNSNVKEIFNYRTTWNDETYTLQELQDKGGNCKDWSELYHKSFEKLGYEINVFYSTINERGIEHRFIYVLDPEYWCIIDMENYMCYDFVKQTELKGGIENGK